MTTRDQAQALNVLITREIAAPGSPPSTILNPLGNPTSNPVAVTVTQTVPARRYDPSLRDEVTAGNGKYFGIDDSRWTVRQDAVNPWRVLDLFVDEEGQRRRVVGVRHQQQQGHISGALIELIGTTS